MRILRHAVATGMVNRRDVLMLRRRIGKSGRDGAGVIGRCLDAWPAFAEYTLCDSCTKDCNATPVGVQRP